MPTSRLSVLLAGLALMPALAWAECSVVRGNGSVNLVVGRSVASCFSSGQVREAFLEDLKKGIAAEEATSRSVPSARARVAPPARPPRPVDGEPGGRYYGQR